jgi:hypothetical protein
MSFPVKTVTHEALLKDTKTEFAVSVYADRVVAIASQTSKFGPVLAARRDLPIDGTETFSVQSLLGQHSDTPTVHDIVARQLAERAKGKQLVLMLSLTPEFQQKTAETEIVRELVSAFDAMAAW